MINIDNLQLAYGITQVSCRLPKNRLIGVLGANGAGKSSLLKAIAGIIEPTVGQIVIGGKDLDKLDYRARSELIAYLAQDTPIHWALSVYDVIALGAVKRLSHKAECEAVQRVAKQCDVEHLLTKNINTLSGGERTRVHLARCLIKDSPILLADEPIASLDPYYQLDMMNYLKQLSANTTCVVVLHHLELAYRFCDDIVLLKNGELVTHGQTDDVMIAENLATAFGISAKIDGLSRTLSIIESIKT